MEALQEVALEQAVVDLCQSCGLVWADWLDGPLEYLARDSKDWLSSDTHDAMAPARTAEEPTELWCPDCKTLLQTEDMGGIVVHRCGNCAGLVVRTGELLRLKFDDKPTEVPMQASLLSRIVRWLRSNIGGGAGQP